MKIFPRRRNKVKNGIISGFSVAALILTIISAPAAFAEDAVNTTYKTIDSYDGYVYAIKTDGDLYRWAYNRENKSCTSHSKVAEDVKIISYNFFLKNDGTLWRIYNEGPSFVMDSVADISSNGYHALIIKTDGSLWGIGYNQYGQLAQGEMSMSIDEQLERERRYKLYSKCEPNYFKNPVFIMDDVYQAAALSESSIVLKKDGSVWSFGGDIAGETGIGYDYVTNNVPTKILDGASGIFANGLSSFAVMNDGTVWRWGTIYSGYAGIGEDQMVTTPQPYIKNAKYVYNESGYNFVIKDDQSLYIYGNTEDAETLDIGVRQYIDAPYKICDNVISITDADYEYIPNHANIILDNKQAMYTLVISDDSELIFKKVANNIGGSNRPGAAFSDIEELGEDTKESIRKLYKAGIIEGIETTKFYPDRSINRAETAALLLRMTGKSNESAATGFSDISSDCWYYNTVGVCQKHGIIDGYDDNTFRGEESVSDLQLVTLAARTLKNEGTAAESDVKQTTKLPDNIPVWAADDITYAIKYGLITEEETGNLSENGMTRGEAAVILYRLYNII